MSEPKRTVPITSDAFQGLVDRVNRLGEAKSRAESATTAALDRRESLKNATVESASADAAEAAANDEVTREVEELKAYVGTLAPMPTPTV